MYIRLQPPLHWACVALRTDYAGLTRLSAMPTLVYVSICSGTQTVRKLKENKLNMLNILRVPSA